MKRVTNSLLRSFQPSVRRFSVMTESNHPGINQMMNHQIKPRGAFILLEGLDRSGKSTQCQMLVDYLNKRSQSNHLSNNQRAEQPDNQSNNESCVLRRFPDRTTPIGKIINDYLTNSRDLSDQAIHLLFASNRWEANQGLIDCLKNGSSIVCDRYSFSGVAFTLAKFEQSDDQSANPSNNQSIDFEWAWSPERGLIAPDLTIFLSLDQSVAESRGGYGEERYEKVAFQSKVRRVFDRLMNRESERGRNIVRVDAGGSINQVAEEIQQHVEKFLQTFQPDAAVKRFD